MSTKTPASYDLVTEKRMVQLMAEWARAADASITAKLVEMEERLRSEFLTVVVQRERKAYENGMIRGSACEFTGDKNGGMEGLLAAVEGAFPLPEAVK